jgi:hypothetical protein
MIDLPTDEAFEPSPKYIMPHNVYLNSRVGGRSGKVWTCLFKLREGNLRDFMPTGGYIGNTDQLGFLHQPLFDFDLDSGFRYQVPRRRLTRILDGAIHKESIQLVAVCDTNVLETKISSHLSLAYAPGVFGHSSRFLQGPPNVVNTKASDQGHERAYYQHPKRPKRHFSLGYKVIFGAFVFVAGLYYFTYALRFAAVLREGEALGYIFLGMAGIAVGIGAMLAYGFAVLPP